MYTAPSRLAAEAWSTGTGSRGPALHADPSKTYTPSRLAPAALKPPITYSLPPATAAAVSSMATGKDASARCAGAGLGEGAKLGGGADSRVLGEGDGSAAEPGPHAVMSSSTVNNLNTLSG